jgi:hypothetical protein
MNMRLRCDSAEKRCFFATHEAPGRPRLRAFLWLLGAVCAACTGPAGPAGPAGAAGMNESPSPALMWVTPGSAMPGETVQVVIAFRGVAPDASTSLSVELGAGSVVSDVTLVDDATLLANVAIADDAVFGPREVVVTLGETVLRAGLWSVAAPLEVISLVPTQQGGLGILGLRNRSGFAYGRRELQLLESQGVNGVGFRHIETANYIQLPVLGAPNAPAEAGISLRQWESSRLGAQIEFASAPDAVRVAPQTPVTLEAGSAGIEIPVDQGLYFRVPLPDAPHMLFASVEEGSEYNVVTGWREGGTAHDFGGVMQNASESRFAIPVRGAAYLAVLDAGTLGVDHRAAEPQSARLETRFIPIMEHEESAEPHATLDEAEALLLSGPTREQSVSVRGSLEAAGEDVFGFGLEPSRDYAFLLTFEATDRGDLFVEWWNPESESWERLNGQYSLWERSPVTTGKVFIQGETAFVRVRSGTKDPVAAYSFALSAFPWR